MGSASDRIRRFRADIRRHELTTHVPGAGNESRTAPVLFVVDADPRALEAAATALRSRFGADYRVQTAGSADEAIEALEQLVGRDDVALIAADLELPARGGIEFLQRAHALHPPGRALLVAMDRRGTRIPFGALERCSARPRSGGSTSGS